MRDLFTIGAAAAFCIAAAPAAALEEFPACVTIVATGDSFALAPLIETGGALNRIQVDGAYDPEAVYLIVPWSNGAKSIIRMEGGRPGPEGAPGVDLEGNEWIVSTDLENCG